MSINFHHPHLTWWNGLIWGTSGWGSCWLWRVGGSDIVEVALLDVSGNGGHWIDANTVMWVRDNGERFTYRLGTEYPYQVESAVDAGTYFVAKDGHWATKGGPRGFCRDGMTIAANATDIALDGDDWACVQVADTRLVTISWGNLLVRDNDSGDILLHRRRIIGQTLNNPTYQVIPGSTFRCQQLVTGPNDALWLASAHELSESEKYVALRPLGFKEGYFLPRDGAYLDVLLTPTEWVIVSGPATGQALFVDRIPRDQALVGWRPLEEPGPEASEPIDVLPYLACDMNGRSIQARVDSVKRVVRGTKWGDPDAWWYEGWDDHWYRHYGDNTRGAAGPWRFVDPRWHPRVLTPGAWDLYYAATKFEEWPNGQYRNTNTMDFAISVKHYSRYRWRDVGEIDTVVRMIRLPDHEEWSYYGLGRGLLKYEEYVKGVRTVETRMDLTPTAWVEPYSAPWSIPYEPQQVKHMYTSPPRDQLLNVLSWLRNEIYPGLVGHPLDDEGITAWLCDRYVTLRANGADHQAAKDRVFAELYAVVHP